MNSMIEIDPAMHQNKNPDTGRCKPLKIFCNNAFLFTAGASAVIAGLLFPQFGYAVDILMIFSLCLTGALVAISMSAGKPLEVTGFPLFVVLMTSVRVFLVIIGSRLVMSKGYGGIIGDFLGSNLASADSAASILFFCILSAAVFFIVAKTARWVAASSSNYITEIFPVRQLNIDSDLKAGLIKEDRAIELRSETACEGAFFAAMTGAARFILFAAFIELLICLFNVVGALAAGSAGGKLGAVSAQSFTGSVFGSAIVTQFSALLVVCACRRLVKKTSRLVDDDSRMSEHEFAERIKVVAREVRTSNYYDETGNEVWYAASELTGTVALDSSGQTRVVTNDLEWTDDSQEAMHAKNPDLPFWHDVQDESFYEQAAEVIAGAGQGKNVLMGAERVEYLGVTLPVNVAMRLARLGRRCLIVDLDIRRNPIAKVFDIEKAAELSSDEIEKYAWQGVLTCIRNLRIWPASWFNQTGSVNLDSITSILTKLERSFDHLIFYAPDLQSLVNKKKFAQSIGVAMLFAGSDETVGSDSLKYYTDLVNNGCKLLRPSDSHSIKN